ncbi:MAG TPA: ArgE/DapE family deacylase [Vicinamibacterales bacterium]|nr:ArgE/DapE family deacylase [Vicinamibacterales bacterium]
MRNATVNASTAIFKAVDAQRADLVAFLQSLIQVPSLPGCERPAHALVAATLTTMGLNVDVVSIDYQTLKNHPAFCDDGIPFDDRINIVGRWRGSGPSGPARETSGGSLILNGHLDVVSPGDLSRWNGSPWSGAVRNGRIYGRGACDMKAGVAAVIFAVAALRSAGVVLEHDVLIESVSGEESGGVGTLATIARGYRAAAAIIMEPTSLKMCPVQAGALTFRLKVIGRSVHACIKDEGVSAIDKAYVLIEALRDLERQRHRSTRNPLYADPTRVAPISIGTIRGGNWHSTVPEELVMEGRYGVMPGESIDAARQMMSEALARAAAADPWLAGHPPTLEWFEGQFESGRTPVDAPIIGVLGASHREVTGSEPAIEGVTYGSDLRLFTNHAGMPAVLYGPGDVRQAHAINESIDLDEVMTATRVLALTIFRWCGGRLAA